MFHLWMRTKRVRMKNNMIYKKNEENMKKSKSVDGQTLGQKNFGEETQTNVMIPMDASLSGLKHAHESGSSDSDKEQVSVQ